MLNLSSLAVVLSSAKAFQVVNLTLWDCSPVFLLSAKYSCLGWCRGTTQWATANDEVYMHKILTCLDAGTSNYSLDQVTSIISIPALWCDEKHTKSPSQVIIRDFGLLLKNHGSQVAVFWPCFKKNMVASLENLTSNFIFFFFLFVIATFPSALFDTVCPLLISML